ncbi:MAG TPA: vWA domain-containing protein [Polyangiaceae bacterium]|nr:vWA domain-containing protein [Polyangiaceae bacterium]
MHFWKKVLGVVGVGALSALLAAGCTDAKKKFGGSGTGYGGRTGTGGKGSAASDAGDSNNCGPGSCTGHSSCSGDNTATCKCDPGYVGGSAPVGEPLTCKVDTSCIKVKPLLAQSCRYLANAAPAVASYFAVDYCAGTAVPPNELGALDQAFKVTEDGVDVTHNVEASVTVFRKQVESYVTFALDVSDSVTQNKSLLTEVVGQMQAIITGLQQRSETKVGISIVVFGRFVGTYLDFTTDLELVKTRLDDLAADPSGAVQSVGGDGTALYDAVAEGIHDTERIQAFRDTVTEGGVLTTGTVVVITDGNNQSGQEALDSDLVGNTVVNLISVGISGDVDNSALQAIGRDGSFLAPDANARAAAFTEITQRVQQYPFRSYLLGYCTPKTEGIHTIEVSLAGGKSTTTAKCDFDTKYFSAVPTVCNKAYFSTDECATVECGGITACGGCDDDQCCSGGQCHKPASATFDCAGQDELCAPSGELCEPDPASTSNPPKYRCTPPVAIGEVCSDKDRCAPGVATCVPDDKGVTRCTVIPSGRGEIDQACGDQKKPDALECKSLSCGQKGAGPDADHPYRCFDAARVSDLCGGDTNSSICELGASCDDKTHLCYARRLRGCERNEDCSGGQCQAGVCYSSGCFWDWNSKLAH